MYRIREVDADDDDIAETILELHRLTFGVGCTLPDLDVGYWWIAYVGDEPAAFAGLTPSTAGPGIGYLKRAGILPEHRGKGLQCRLIRVREIKARRLGWTLLLTDTTENPPSANNLASRGFKMFTPDCPWAFKTTLYWRKRIA